MPYISYEYDPNDPEDKKRAKEKAYAGCFTGFILLWGTVGAVILYIYSIVASFGGDHSGTLFSIVILIIMSIVDYFILFGDTGKLYKQRKKKYFLIYYGGAFELATLIGIVVSVGNLCHEGQGLLLLIGSTIGFLICTVILLLINKIIDGNKISCIRLFSSKEMNCSPLNVVDNLQENVVNGSYIYCHKCGKRLQNDSMFCGYCGIKLR